MRDLARVPANLIRLAREIGRAIPRVARESRSQRYAWLAFVLVPIDVLVRGPSFSGWCAGKLAQYAARVVLMALLWAGLGTLLCVAAQYARQRRFIAFMALAPWPGTAMLLLLMAAGAHLSFFVVNRYFAEPTILRDVWSLRGVIASYMHDLPWVVFFAVVGSLGLCVGLACQAWRRAREASPGTVARIVWGFALACSAGIFAEVIPRSDDSFVFSPPDAGALHLLCEAMRSPPPFAVARPRGPAWREPVAVPRLTRVNGVPNILVILTESVRADAMCSDPHACSDQYVDPAAPDRIPLPRLRTQAPNTFTTCMVLWTGLEPDSEFPDTHRAPLLWEVARAAGYHTVYVSAQSPDILHFSRYIAVAGIDYLVTARDLQPSFSEALGADDERAMQAMLEHAASTRTPWYGVLQLANTHAFYRTDPSLQPFQPEAGPADLAGFKNRYLNSVALQRRSLGAFLTRLRALPQWDDTLVLFLSDHGESLGEHEEIFHLKGIFESLMRVPGWVLSGKRALTPEQQSALTGNAGRYLYTRDLHATLLDALGVWDERWKIPYSGWRSGRSLLRPLPAAEPIAVFSTVGGLWEFSIPSYGVVQGEHKLISGKYGPFRCYDTREDPREENPRAASACGAELFEFARSRFPRLAR